MMWRGTPGKARRARRGKVSSLINRSRGVCQKTVVCPLLSLAVLAKATGRQPGTLSRTLKTMSRYGLVDLQREKNTSGRL